MNPAASDGVEDPPIGRCPAASGLRDCRRLGPPAFHDRGGGAVRGLEAVDDEDRRWRRALSLLGDGLPLKNHTTRCDDQILQVTPVGRREVPSEVELKTLEQFWLLHIKFF